MTLLSYSPEPNPAPTTTTPEPAPEKVKKPVLSGSLGFWCCIIFLAFMAVTYGYLLNPVVGGISVAMAMIPLAVLITISFFAVPRSEVSINLRLNAILWGAVGATSLTLLLTELVTKLFGQVSTTISVVVQAPLIEESSKGVFIFCLFFFFKQLVRTPLAGAMLGFLVGSGFAFVENILYFTNSYVDGGWVSLWQTVIMRAGVSFFIHPMATLFTGLLIGYVVSRWNHLRLWRKLGFLLMGPASAMTVHGLWNGFTSITTDGGKWDATFLGFWVPLVIFMALVVAVIRHNYMKIRVTLFLAAAKKGYIRIQQAERMADPKERHALYKKAAKDMLVWESSILRLNLWDERIAAARSEKKIDKLNKRKSEDVRALSEVITTV